MNNTKKFHLMAAVLCTTVFLCGFSATAHAGGGEEYAEPAETSASWEGLSPAEDDETTNATAELTQEEPLITGEGFSEEGNLTTRDLLYDGHTNKQFLTVQTRNGSTFYMVIDYDKPVNEEEEQYQTYFLNMVDEADLLAALEAAGGEAPVCSCIEKCVVGAVNRDCPVCATGMTGCAGTAPEPVEEAAPVPETEQKNTGNAGRLLLVFLVCGIGGGAGWYFKVYRPGKERAAEASEEYGGGEDFNSYGEEEAGQYLDEEDEDADALWDFGEVEDE